MQVTPDHVVDLDEEHAVALAFGLPSEALRAATRERDEAQDLLRQVAIALGCPDQAPGDLPSSVEAFLAQRDRLRAEVAELRAAIEKVAQLGATGMTPAEVAAAPWWRWCEGLRTLCGNRVHSVEGGVWALQRQRGANTWTEVRLRDPKPDLGDPFLPGWLRDLLRERMGPMTHAHPNFAGEWVVWVGEGMAWSRLASGPTEMEALIAALQEVTK